VGGPENGTWNLTLDSSNRLFGVANTANGAALIQGTDAPGATPNVSVTFHHGSGSGNVDPTNGSGGGTWSKTTSSGTVSDTWTATTSGC
jgi:hypothetical protein